MDQTAITYPYVTVNELTGETIKTILEDVADNLFNPDPYYQQGGDMVRVGGLQVHDRSDARRWASASRAWNSPASRSMPRRSTRSPAGRRCRKRRRPPAARRSGTCARATCARRRRCAAHAQPADDRGHGGQPGDGDVCGRRSLRHAAATDQSALRACLLGAGFSLQTVIHRTRANLRLPACTTTVVPARNDERLVGHDIAVDLEAALRDEPQRLRRGFDEARLLRELRDRNARRRRRAASPPACPRASRRRGSAPRTPRARRRRPRAEWKRATISCASSTLASRGLRPPSHSRLQLRDLVERAERQQLVVAPHQHVGDRHQLAEHLAAALSVMPM